MQRIIIPFIFVLMLVLAGCSSPLPEYRGPVPPVVACLDSPLLNRADSLAEEAPEQNLVRLLEIGDEALLARVHLIRSARSSIEIQTLIWANDESGRLVMYELLQAARRGVKVRLLIDHVASEQHIDIATALSHVHENVEIRLYNPVIGIFGQVKADPSFIDKINAALFKFDRTNRRMHNKTFIVDGRVGITGGRNYENTYYDRAHGLNFKDRDILAIGPVVEEMERSFEEYWNCGYAARLADLADVRMQAGERDYRSWYARENFALNGLFEAIDRDASRLEQIEALFADSLLAVEKVRFVADDPRRSRWSVFHSNGDRRVTEELTELVARARQEVYIQTPYLVLSSEAVKLFRKLRKKNPAIDLRISTNSLAATDSWYVYGLSYKQKRLFIDDLGFSIFEFRPLPGDLYTFMPQYDAVKARAEVTHRERYAREVSRQQELLSAEFVAPPKTEMKEPFLCMHAKSLVIDDKTSFVGSYNLDPRSENINTECGLIIEDRAFAALLKGEIEVDMQPQNSWVIAKKERPMVIGEANAALVALFSIIPLADVWPFRYTASFELKHGREAVAPDHPKFYKNYKDVGNFPGLKTRDLAKALGVRSTKAFFGFVKPLL